jgi:gamma-glutamyltranspeptidase / glutathione hydrolase
VTVLPEPAVAAADVATAAVGARVLAAGGNAADAAVAAALAACAVETIYTGLAGGGFAVHWDAARREAMVVDFFVDVPGQGLDRTVAPMAAIQVSFGAAPLEYHVGPATVAVPGNPAGLVEVQRRFGRLPWHSVVQPAYELADGGVSLSVQKAVGLAVMRQAMCLGEEGRSAYAPRGRLLDAGERLWHRGLASSFAALRDEGAEPFYRGRIAEAMLEVVTAGGGALTERDLATYQTLTGPARAVEMVETCVRGRTDLLDLLGTLAAMPADLGQLSAADRTEAWVRALLDPARGTATTATGTSNVCATDADGNACAITTSLGLGSGDWVPGYGLHLNSMIGEGELMLGSGGPGSRVPSMMAPLVATDDDGVLAVAGAAGGSRIRSAMLQVLSGVLAERVHPEEAVRRPRVHPVRMTDAAVVHCEPGVSSQARRRLAADGLVLQEWDRTSAYFGGVSVIGRDGAAADPRRDGAVGRPPAVH